MEKDDSWFNEWFSHFVWCKIIFLTFQQEYEEEFIELMCLYDEKGVLTFLESHVAYNPDHCLNVTMKYGIFLS